MTRPLTAHAVIAAPMPGSSLLDARAGFVRAGQRLSPVVQRSSRSGRITYVTREERFHALFEEHYRAVARFLRTRRHEPADADDLIAGVFEVVWRQMDKVPEGREALPWLLGIARNLSRNARRKSQREASFVNELSATTLPWDEMPVEDRAASAEVMGALAQLKPVDRDLILLVAWDELTPSEAGQVLGLRAVTARSRLHRARQRLSALLSDSAADSAASSPPYQAAEEDRRGH
jgi:RNA polymerase sigma factor (sigma-70 family)